jgi:SAM-dependent methyltransferase
MTRDGPDPDFAEDMPALVRRAVALAETTCRGCATWHGTWPARRLAGGIRSVDSNRALLGPLFRELAEGSTDDAWLIAGSGDTGPLATMAASLGPVARSFHFTVVDLCDTPLELCREYAVRTGLKVDVERADILDFVPRRKPHLVFGHSVLAHMAPDDRAHALARFHDWLAPGGVLVNVTSVDRQPEPDESAAAASIERLLAACRAAGIDDEPTLERLARWRRERFANAVAVVRTVPEEGESERLCKAAGFAEIRRIAATSSLPDRRPHDVLVARKG